MDEEKLISLVQQHPLVYDPRHPHHKDLRRKEAAWSAVAQELGVSNVEAVKVKWKNIRDTYVRNVRVRACAPSGSGGGAAPKEYKYYHILSFLQPSVQPRSSRGNLDDSAELSATQPLSPAESASTPTPSSGSEDQEEMESSQEQVACPQASTGPRATLSTPTFSRKKKRTTVIPNEELLAVLKSPIPKDDEDESFALSLVPELKKVVTNKGQLKLQVLSIIVNWEQQQQGAPPSSQPPSWPRPDFYPPPASFHPTPPSLYSVPHDLPHSPSGSATSAAQSEGSWFSP